MPAAVPPQRTILLLDDDPALRKLLSRLLNREGYQVREASSAVEELRVTGIDLAIVNFSDRVEEQKAVRSLRRAYPELMVLVLSEMLALAETPRLSSVRMVVESVRDLMSRPVSRVV
jgi:DNA-binding response OmpR family regulator